MNFNNPIFQLNDDMNYLSGDSGQQTPLSFSSGQCTPNSQFSSCYDIPNFFESQPKEENDPFDLTNNFDPFGRNFYQQYAYNQRFGSLMNNSFVSGNNDVSYGSQIIRNDMQYFNCQNKSDAKKYSKFSNRNRRTYNNDEDYTNSVQDSSQFEYKNYKENDVSKLFRLFRFLHHLVTFEENLDISSDNKIKFFIIGLPYPNTMHINTHLKYACEIACIVHKTLDNRFNHIKIPASIIPGSKIFMSQLEDHIYATQEFCNVSIEHKNNVVLLAGGKDKMMKLFNCLELLIEDVKEARAIYHMLYYYQQNNQN